MILRGGVCQYEKRRFKEARVGCRVEPISSCCKRYSMYPASACHATKPWAADRETTFETPYGNAYISFQHWEGAALNPSDSHGT